jgi:[citrate (pro-3S)-lyase] ligase
LNPYLFREESIDLQNPGAITHITEFLKQQHLRFESDVEYTHAIFKGNQLIGTGSLSGSVLKCLAVDPLFQGEGIAARIVSRLIQEAYARSRDHLFIYSYSSHMAMFRELGFHEIITIPQGVSLLENKPHGLQQYLDLIRGNTREKFPDEDKMHNVSAIVMNANPFTLGHQYLAETAARSSEILHVFVVAEERSSFPAEVRFQLIQEGTAHLPNVIVHSGEHYIISAATFPSYFLKDQSSATAIHCQLDLALFGSQIAPALGIKKRYVGQEPYCQVTKLYNETMKHILPAHGIEVIEIQRLSNQAGWISASTVREHLRQNDLSGLDDLVPASTLKWLKSDMGRIIIENLRDQHGRH